MILELDTFQGSKSLKTNFYQAKTLELLSYLFRLYQDDSKKESQIRSAPHLNLKKIREIANFIDYHVADVGTIGNLATMGGMNEMKLQKGFQLLFKNSVYGYIQQVRFKKAMFLLCNTDKTITEIINEVGLNSRSHFSKIFKKKFGRSPRNIRTTK